MKIFILFLIIVSLIGLYFMMKSERFYKWRNYMWIFFITLPILFIVLVWLTPFIKWWTNGETATLFQFIQEASTFAKSSRLYLSLITIIIWMFLFGYMQMIKYSHWLGIYIFSVVTSLSVIIFIMDMLDAVNYLKETGGHMTYPSIGSLPFMVLLFAGIAYIMHSIIYIKKYAKK